MRLFSHSVSFALFAALLLSLLPALAAAEPSRQHVFEDEPGLIVARPAAPAPARSLHSVLLLGGLATGPALFAIGLHIGRRWSRLHWSPVHRSRSASLT